MKKVKKEAPRRRKKIKIDFEALPSAIVNKKLVAKVKAKVLFERMSYEENKVFIHEGQIISYYPDDGFINVWDDTKGQFFVFREKDPVNIKVLRTDDLVPEAQVEALKSELQFSKLQLKIMEEKMSKIFVPVEV